MRASVTSLSKKLLSTLFAATLALGLVPAAAFAVDENSESANADRIETADQNVISSEEVQDDFTQHVISTETSDSEASGEISSPNDGDGGISMPAATERINQDMTLQSRTVAQAESTRSYFLATTLESTRTVPIVSANLPLDTGSIDVVESEAEGEGTASQEEEGDDGDDDPDSDDPAHVISTEASDSERSGEISLASTVIGSFTYNGITYAVEPGGETVAVVAADYNKLPEDFVEAQAIVLPSVITIDGIDYFSVTRIADHAFTSLNADNEGITALTIPATITNIEQDAFNNFHTLQYIIVSEENPVYGMYDGCLYNADRTCLLLIPEGRLGAVRVAPSVTEVAPEAFSHCPSVTTLVADPDSAASQLLDGSDLSPIDLMNSSEIVAEALDAIYSGYFESLNAFSGACEEDAETESWSITSAADEMQSFGVPEEALVIFGSRMTNRIFRAATVVDTESKTAETLDVLARESASAISDSIPGTGSCTFQWQMVPSVAYYVTFAANQAPSNWTQETPTTKRWSDNGTQFKMKGYHWWRWSGDTGHANTAVCTSHPVDTATDHTGYNSGCYTVEFHSSSGGYYMQTPYLNAALADCQAGTGYGSAYTQIYGKATARAFTVTFDEKGATTHGTTSLGVTYNASVSNISVPKKTGYDFDGYYAELNADGTGKGDKWFDSTGKYVKQKTYQDFYNESPSLNWGTASNKTLYAGWTPYPYTVSLNANGGSVSSATVPAAYDADVTLPTPTRTGYTFSKWTTALNGTGTSYAAGKITKPNMTLTKNGTVTLYAQWTANKYKVNYYNNAGTEILSSDDGFVYGTSRALAGRPSSGATPNKVLTGWATTPQTAQATYGFGSGQSALTDTPNGTVSLYLAEAKQNTFFWMTDLNVAYYVPGQEGESSEKPHFNGKDPFQLSGSHWWWYSTTHLNNTVICLTHPGTDHWNHTDRREVRLASCSGGYTITSPYIDTAGTRPTVNQNYTQYLIYGKAVANPYTVTFDEKGATTHGDTSLAVTYNADVSTIKVPQKTGYTFDGYFEKVDSNGRGVGDVWFNTNGIYVKQKTYMDIWAETPSTRWGTASNKTLYAGWTPNTYQVSFNSNGGASELAGKTVTATYDVDLPEISTKNTVKEGYNFAGWWDEDSDNGTPYYTADGKSAHKWDKTEDFTLIARWTRGDSLMVSLSDDILNTKNGPVYYWPGEGHGYVTTSDSTDVVSANSKIVDVPDGDGHFKFLGYYDGESDDAEMMIDGEGRLTANAPALTASTTWFAKWERVSSKVVLDSNYGGWDSQMKTSGTEWVDPVEYGKGFAGSIGEFVAPERKGHTFLGYYDSPANAEVPEGDEPEGTCWIAVVDGEPVSSSDEWNVYPATVDGAVTLYAAWQLDDCVVTLNMSVPEGTERVEVSGGGTLSEQTWHYDEARPGLPMPKDGSFSRNGYAFMGWYYLDGKEKVFVSDSEGEPIPEVWDKEMRTLTIYPDWEKKTYELAFTVECPDVEGLEKPSAPANIENIAYDTNDFKLPQLSYGAYKLEWLTASNEVFADVHMTDGRFTPRGDLAMQTSAPIVLHAEWTLPDEQHTFTLYTGHPGTGEVLSHPSYDFTYGIPVPLTGFYPDPARIEGYEFDHWVRAASAEDAEEMIESRNVTGERVDSFSGLQTEDAFFVAKWSAHELSVTLVTTPDDDGKYFDVADDVLMDRTAEGASTWSAAYEKAYPDAEEGEWKHASKMVYDLELGSFALPEVKRTGYDFEGWEPVDEASERVLLNGVVDPRSQTGSIGLHKVSYRPIFKAATYEIKLMGNGLGADEETKTVAYDESFAFPYPTTLANGSVFRCWANVSKLYQPATDKTFLKGLSVPLAPGTDSDGDETPGLASLAAPGTRTITLYAIWEDAFSVDVPIVASLAVDVDTNDVIATKHTLAPTSTNATKSYEIESLRYEPAYKTIDGVEHAAFEGAQPGEVYLSVYAGLPSELDDERNLLKSDNVRANGTVFYADSKGAKPLLIGLGGTSSRLFSKSELDEVTVEDTHGFLPFDTESFLTIRYGLFFPNADTAKKFDFARGVYHWRLPENDHANANGFSSESVDVAKLTYTVSMKTK